MALSKIFQCFSILCYSHFIFKYLMKRLHSDGYAQVFIHIIINVIKKINFVPINKKKSLIFSKIMAFCYFP